MRKIETTLYISHRQRNGVTRSPSSCFTPFATSTIPDKSIDTFICSFRKLCLCSVVVCSSFVNVTNSSLHHNKKQQHAEEDRERIGYFIASFCISFSWKMLIDCCPIRLGVESKGKHIPRTIPRKIDAENNTV